MHILYIAKAFFEVCLHLTDFVSISGRRKKTRDEFQMELFQRKRSRKNIREVRRQSFDFDTIVEAETDFSSDDEHFFTTPSRGKVNTIKTQMLKIRFSIKVHCSNVKVLLLTL